MTTEQGETGNPSQTRDELIAELLALPAAVGQAYHGATVHVEHRLGSDDLYKEWLSAALDIAGASFRAWEAAAEYVRSSPAVLDALERPQDAQQWYEIGRSLSGHSAALASSYFRASASFLERHDVQRLPAWISAGETLFHGTWKSGALAARFFELSPGLLDHVRLSDLATFANFLDRVAQHSSELAEECLTMASDSLPYVDNETIDSYLALLDATAGRNWKYAKETQRAAAIALPRIARPERERFLSFAINLENDGGKRYLSFLAEGSRAISDLPLFLHRQVLDDFEVLCGLSQEAGVEFLRATPLVLKRIDDDNLSRWFTEGVSLLERNEAAGIAFFKLESSRGEVLLQELSATISLDDIAPILQMYARGLTGGNMQLRPTPELANRSIGWATEDRASTDGTNIFLPPEIALFETKDDNFGWFKVLCTHQTGHLEFHSFDFAFNRSGWIFPTTRPAIEASLAEQSASGSPQERVAVAPNPEMTGTVVGVLSDFERFFDLFPERRLASDLFGALEDARIDHLVKGHYRGLRHAYGMVQAAAVIGRPAPQQLPLREALIELLIRMTLLEGDKKIPVPQNVRDVVDRMAGILYRLRHDEATVEDSAEATVILYRLLIKVPNTAPQPDLDWDETELDELGGEGAEGFQEADSAQQGGEEFVPGSGTEQDVPYQSPEDVDYRGDFKPELVQTIANLRKGQQRAEDSVQAPPLTEEMVRQLLEKSAEIDLSSVVEGDIDDPSGLFISSLMSEAIEGPDAEFKDEMGEVGAGGAEGEDSEEALPEEERTALYDEWDFVALDYKPAWCRVRETTMQEGSADFYNETIERHAGLVNEVRRQFEMMVPETYRKEKRLTDGEEFDLDAVIDAVVQRKAGGTPDDKVYWRRNKTERDVAVIFLLDMSASTAEAIEERSDIDDDDEDIPDDPRQYLFWLRSRREQQKRSYLRIIDLEKESTVLLIRALESIGDQYGIYGFSGYGRENVEFYSIKGLEEPFSDRVTRRIDGITPLHATRMGPAIRHAVAKLDAASAKTKVLFLISDGRPQDRGYSREGAEKEYAVQDTHMALLEAKAKGIIPFLLTVDRAGHDYMKEMCGDLPYEVLADIQLLPKRLPQLYSRLTL